MSVTKQDLLDAIQDLKEFTLSNLVKLDAKIDANTDRLERKIVKLEVRVDDGFADLGGRLTDLERKRRR